MARFDLDRLLLNKVRRRRFLIGTGALTGLAISSQWHKVIAQPRFSAYPFSLGVASGDPLANSVVLWTRLAPEPFNGGGMPSVNVPVQWQIADDEKMRRIISSGTAMATPEMGHSVHVEAQGLRPATWYWYRFRVGNEVSPIGRTRTAPRLGDRTDQFRFAITNCQQWQNGYYAAYKHMAQEDLDLVLHVGDYIYEGTITDPNSVRPDLPPEHVKPEPTTIEAYRNRHALYKLDPNLQATHARFPWAVTWDDHEVDNNYAGEVPQDPELQSTEDFLRRRAAAYQVYYEHMPLRQFSIPRGPDMQLYRRLTFGDLIEFNILDTRQYRDDQGCGPGDRVPACPDFTDPNRSMLGSTQESWLFQGLDRSRSRWNVISAQVIMAQFDYRAGPEQVFSGDKWDGYAASRDRLLQYIQQRQPSNPVVLSGDAHINLVNDLKLDFNNPNSATVATEFTSTAITSSGVNSAGEAAFRQSIDEAPHIKYYEGFNRGYVRCTLNRDQWRSDYQAVDTVEIELPAGTAGRVINPDAAVRTQASWVVENGKAGAERA